MQLILTCFAIAVFLYWCFLFVAARSGWPQITLLPQQPEEQQQQQQQQQHPLVSVIVAAKEEEATIQHTIQHLLDQQYPRLEIIAVNDRSQDGTGVQLEQLKQWSECRPQTTIPLRIVHITQLPEGWLGKNHALYQGYLQAKGSYLLFTDADVRFAPRTIRDAVIAAEQQRIDHLTLAPLMVARSFWLRLFVHYFLFVLQLFLRMWRANDDSQQRYGTGIGAFNLIRRETYETLGTHRAIAMRPDDDLQLGMHVKRTGGKQRLFIGKHHLHVEWYPRLRDAVYGLEKNLFAGFQYRLSVALIALAGQAVAYFGPFAGLLLLPHWSGMLCAVSAALMVTLYIQCTRRFAALSSWKEAAALPIAVWLLVVVMARTVYLTVRRGGIYWRGTFYTLDQLRRERSHKNG